MYVSCHGLYNTYSNTILMHHLCHLLHTYRFTAVALLLTLTLTQTLTILPRIMSLYPFVNIVYLILCVALSKIQFIYLFIILFNQLQTSIHHGRHICSSELVVGKDWAALIGEFYSATPNHLNKHQELSFKCRTSLHG